MCSSDKTHPKKEIGYFKTRICLAGIFIATFLAASVMRSQRLFVADMYRFQEFLGGDIATHFFMGAILMLAGLLLILPVSIWRAIGVLLVVLAMVCLEEISQIWIPSRNFSWQDLSMGVVGALSVMLGASGWYLVRSLLSAGASRAGGIGK